MPPNIVVIMTDQQRWDTLGCLGFRHMVTPNLDALARRGACFSHAFAQGAICTPSRASIVTGKYVHGHGAEQNETWVRPTEPNWIEALRQGGYHTANIGKMHTAPIRLPCGFDYRLVVENKNYQESMGGLDDYDLFLREKGITRPAVTYFQTIDDWYDRLGACVWSYEESWYPDNFIGQRALDYLQQYDFAQPLMFWAGFAGPHDPYDITASALERYPGDGIPEPVGFPGEADEKPEEHRVGMERMDGSRTLAAIWWSRATPERIRTMRRHYYANIMLIDEWVGRIVAELERQGQLENTVFLFTSDHGDCLGDHGSVYKFTTHYDSVVRVPLIFAGPGVQPQGRNDALVELIDLGATVLELAGLPVLAGMDGRSLCPLLQGEQVELHEAVYSECPPRRFMVRTREWKLVYYPGKPYGELYHLAEDPNELHNRYTSPAHAETRHVLEERLLTWMTETRMKLQ
ncbi:MAG: sulfatase family protein [Armatimonadota bacterium]